MKTRLVNGYNVTGNHGTGAERVYCVCDAAGKVLGQHDGAGPAVAAAAARPLGDVLKPKPVPKVASQEKPAAKPKTAKTQQN